MTERVLKWVKEEGIENYDAVLPNGGEVSIVTTGEQAPGRKFFTDFNVGEEAYFDSAEEAMNAYEKRLSDIPAESVKRQLSPERPLRCATA